MSRRRRGARDRAGVAAHRKAFAHAVAQSRVRYGTDALIGMAVADARSVVEAAGGQFVTDDQPIAAKSDPTRVVATVTDGRVTAVVLG